MLAINKTAIIFSMLLFATVGQSSLAVVNSPEEKFKHVLECEHLKECKYTKHTPMKEYSSKIFGISLEIPTDFKVREFPNTDHGHFLEAENKRDYSEFLYEWMSIDVNADRSLKIYYAIQSKDKKKVDFQVSYKSEDIKHRIVRNLKLNNESKMYGVKYPPNGPHKFFDGIFYINKKKWYVIQYSKDIVGFTHKIESENPYYNGTEVVINVSLDLFYKAGDTKDGGRSGPGLPISELDLSTFRKYIYSILGSLEYRFPKEGFGAK